MKDIRSGIKILQRPRSLRDHAKTGVSLHCHTEHSKENMDFVPYYAERIPVVAFFWQRECEKVLASGGTLPNFNNGFWSPPLTGSEVFESERKNLSRYSLDAIISITDHDSITANLEIQSEITPGKAPISLEWTVPFRHAFLHVGVHNLPHSKAELITKQLLDYTNRPADDKELHALFSLLNDISEVLVVLNHPIWDIERIGQENHLALLKDFLSEHGKWIHAFEVNGFRSWSENKLTIQMAEALGFPIVSGGDRHCCSANAIVNLTNASEFSEFVEEVRRDRHSQLVLMPEYNEPLNFRQVRSVAQILGHYPQFPEGRKRWTDRVFHDTGDGKGLQSLSVIWKDNSPSCVRLGFMALAILSHSLMKPIFNFRIPVQDRVFKRGETVEMSPIFGAGRAFADI